MFYLATAALIDANELFRLPTRVMAGHTASTRSRRRPALATGETVTSVHREDTGHETNPSDRWLRSRCGARQRM
jgi:hypothetical protein